MNRFVRSSAFWLAAILLLTVAACGGAANSEPTPPAIHYGEDICEFCGMITSEERHAAAFVSADGHGHIFDDIGDMVQLHLQEPDDVVAFFVHDYQDGAWIRAETAHYVRSDEVTTPMFSGLAAFASSEQAEALADELQGQMLSFDDVLAHYQGMASMDMEEEAEHDAHDP